jgi:endonuclease/exonuclease/phosphatase family metal-dependent hydrolase
MLAMPLIRTALLLALAAMTIGAAPARRDCAPLRVMTYNIRLNTESDGINRWANRREQFIGQVRLMHPAILGLQEVVADQKADLERGLPGYVFLGVGREDGKSKGEFSNLAVERAAFQVRSSGTFWLSPTPDRPSKGWDAALPRIATWAKLVRKSDGRHFLALNTHFDHIGEQARLESARQIVRWIESNRAPGEAVISTGDLNTVPGSPPVQALLSDSLGLRDARAASKSSPVGPEGTFNNFAALPEKSERIDYVLVGPSLGVERYAVLAWHGEGGRVASDHFPVVADVTECGK